jgi:hypothetical protein
VSSAGIEFADRYFSAILYQRPVMSASKSEPSFSTRWQEPAQQGGRTMPLATFLALTLLLPVVIVIANTVIGALTPITANYDDDMSLVDPVWRIMQGQHLGIDFHDPRGFGLFQVAGVLWRLLGPHYYVLRASNGLIAFAIVFCAWLVARRQLRHVPGIAALFCITVALEASGPSIYGDVLHFGMSLSYDRLLMSAFSVLFVQTFVKNLNCENGRDFFDHLICAFLLNILFLVKISGLILALAIVPAGYIVRGRPLRGLIDGAQVLLLLAVMLAIDFVVTGTSLTPVIQDYKLAAQARTGAYSALDGLGYSFEWTVIGVIVLMALYAVAQSGRENTGNLWRCFLIILIFWMCQVVLNMSNYAGGATIFLAPAAVLVVVTWTGTSDSVAIWADLWSRLHPRRLHKISARETIPLLIFALVFLPETLAALRAVKRDISIAAGISKPVAVTSDKGITFEILSPETVSLALSFNGAVQAIEGLHADRDTIDNLDFMNPFPALFLSPAPKGVWVFWDFGYNVPIGYEPRWQEILGDACVVTEPKHPLDPAPAARLTDALLPHLESAFDLVYEDDSWKIWKRTSGCGPTIK